MVRTKRSAHKQAGGSFSRGGSADSDEHARPLRKGRRGKQPQYAEPSSESDPTPSEDDLNFEDEVEEEDTDYVAEDPPEFVARPAAAPKAKLKVRRAARGSSSASGAHDDETPDDAPPEARVHISCDPVVSFGRLMTDYSKMPLDDYRRLRRVSQFGALQDCEDSRFLTNVQADIFTSVALRKGLANSHACIPLAFIRSHSSHFPGVVDIIDSMGLTQAFGFKRDWNQTAILQFYATCYFQNREVTWMTGDHQYTATFRQFAEALGFRSSGTRIHVNNNKEKPKGINDCLCFVESGLEGDDCKRKPNDVSIWQQPYHFLYQCVLRTLYPKSGDKTHCSSTAISLMYLMALTPRSRLDVPHFLWHEIRMASLQHRRHFPHAPFIMALIESVVPSQLEITHTHTVWTIPAHMYFTAPAVQMTRPIPVHSTVAGAMRRQSSEQAPMRRIAQFLGKAQAAMMRAISFNCHSNHTVVTRLIQSKNSLKARLRAAGEANVSDDERLPDAPPADLGFDFPTGPDRSDFYPGDHGASGSGTH